MKLKCTDPYCKYSGEDLVDLGYTFPVCPGQPAQLYPKPLEEKYRGKGYKKMYKVTKIKVE